MQLTEEPGKTDLAYESIYRESLRCMHIFCLKLTITTTYRIGLLKERKQYNTIRSVLRDKSQ
jgi:hypothetical protein